MSPVGAFLKQPSSLVLSQQLAIVDLTEPAIAVASNYGIKPITQSLGHERKNLEQPPPTAENSA